MNENETENSVYRILDAAINRAGEGIRVVEDYLRMVVADRNLATLLKQLRHDLTTATGGLDQDQLIAARDADRDVGREIRTETEYQRNSSASLVQSNMARAQQALRAIEEFSKPLVPDVSLAVEQLRYQAYTIEKAVLTTMLSIDSLADQALYVLVECPARELNGKPETDLERLKDNVRQLIGAGVGLLQLRDKRLNDRQLVAAGKCLTELTRGTKTRWIMNDRADLALVSGADGVHLGQEDLPVAGARRILGAAKMIGVSTHNLQQARQAVIDGANYIGVGPVFSTQTKSFSEYVGTEFVRAVSDEIQLPAFAIGGINQKNVGQVVAAGLRRIAVSAAVTAAEDPSAAAVRLIGELNKILTS